MKILDLLTDIIQESSLMEMAFQRKVIRKKVGSLQYQIAIHLCKVLFFPNDRSYSHWITEINTWLRTIDDMRLTGSGNKKLNPRDYYHILFEQMFSNGVAELDSKIRHLKLDGYNVSNLNEQEKYMLYQTLEEIYHNISYDIANDKFETIKNYL